MAASSEQMREMLRLMHTIRAFEQKALELYRQSWDMGNFLGALHSSEGQEAVAVGACACVTDTDYLLSTHRGHGHFVAKGGDVNAMMAELLGKEAGCSRGRGGSMHMFDLSKGLLGGNGIVGGGIPLALGPAFTAKYKSTDQVTLCFFGDGGSSQGGFHEALNLAALWDLPVIYICEHNQYAVTTPGCDQTSVSDVAVRAAGYGIPGVTVDGNDVLAVYEVVNEAVDRARTGKGPSLIEAKTFRHRPHCMVIPETRAEDELEEWKQRDPIPRFEAYCLANGVMNASEAETLKSEVYALLDEAAQFAIDAPFPDPATVAEGMWVS